MIKTSQEDLKNLFKSLNLKSGDDVMVHSALFTLGLIEGGVGGFYKAIREHLGDEGTLIVPTFTYSFRRNEVFDIKNTRSASNIGIFPEYVRSMEGSIRSPDPMFSMASIGPRSNEFMKRSSKASFGAQSIYEKLFNNNIKFLAIGITYSTGLTGFLHIEKIASVPYRRDLLLTGKSIAIDGSIYEDESIHFARNESEYISRITNREPMGEILELNGASIVTYHGNKKHMCIEAEKWKNIVLESLQKNPCQMLI